MPVQAFNPRSHCTSFIYILSNDVQTGVSEEVLSIYCLCLPKKNLSALILPLCIHDTLTVLLENIYTQCLIKHSLWIWVSQLSTLPEAWNPGTTSYSLKDSSSVCQNEDQFTSSPYLCHLSTVPSHGPPSIHFSKLELCNSFPIFPSFSFIQASWPDLSDSCVTKVNAKTYSTVLFS